MTGFGTAYPLPGGRSTTQDTRGATKGDRPAAYAYARRHLLMVDSEMHRAKERLQYFADSAGYELAVIFVEEIEAWPSAFEQLLHAVIRDKVEIVILPSLLHFTVLGAPRHIKRYFEAATGARVVTTRD